MGRFLAVLAGIFGAVVLSQGPGFTLQYMQNLGGRVDELRPIVEEFEENIQRFGYTRARAMAECETSTGLLEALCANYESVVRRYEMLAAHYEELKAAEDYARPILLAKTYQEDIVKSVMEDFEPAVSLEPAALIYSFAGLAGGWGLMTILWGILSLPFRQRYADI